MNGNFSNVFDCSPPFVLRLSKDEGRVFQQNQKSEVRDPDVGDQTSGFSTYRFLPSKSWTERLQEHLSRQDPSSSLRVVSYRTTPSTQRKHLTNFSEPWRPLRLRRLRTCFATLRETQFFRSLLHPKISNIFV